VEVRRGLRGLGRAPGLTSTVTYQVGDISDPQERLVHWAANHGGMPKKYGPNLG
jgi:hypothetical protein